MRELAMLERLNLLDAAEAAARQLQQRQSMTRPRPHRASGVYPPPIQLSSPPLHSSPLPSHFPVLSLPSSPLPPSPPLPFEEGSANGRGGEEREGGWCFVMQMTKY